MGTDKDINNTSKYNENIQSQLESCIESFCSKYGIEDMRKESQNVFNACLMYCNKCMFPNQDILKYKYNYDTNIMPTNHNSYNYDLLYIIIDNLLYISNMLDKECSIYTFHLLTNIDLDTIYNWGNNNINNNKSVKGLTYKSIDLFKRLVKANEETLSGILVSGKRNIMGATVKLNSKFGWNGANGQQSGAIELKPITELPSLGQIAQNENI